MMDVSLASAGSASYASCLALMVRQPTGKRICFAFDGGKYAAACLSTLAQALSIKHGGGVQGALST